jgi:glycosyltransferase involved in cell wall biosynthesis
MRLLHVSHQYPPAIGGSEKYIADLSEQFIQRGHQVRVLTSQSKDYHVWRNELASFETINGVPVYRYKSLQRRAYVWRMLHFGLRNYWVSRARRFEPFIFLGGGPISPGLAHAIYQQAPQFDLVHLNCLVYGHAAYGYWIAKQLGLPIVLTPHAHFDQEVTYNIGYQREVLHGADHVLADTPGERAMFIQLGLPPERVSVGGVGLNQADYDLPANTKQARRELGLPEDGFYMLFLGRKAEYKGLGLAIEAFRILRQRHPQLKLLAVGPETDYSRALWQENATLPGLHRFGLVTDAEKLLALQAANCLVLPSAGEAFGIVFLEAWLREKPVVGMRNVAVETLISAGQDGLLAEPGDLVSLVEAVETLLTQPALARQMGQAGRAKVLRQYTKTAIADRVEGIYLRTLRARQRQEG